MTLSVEDDTITLPGAGGNTNNGRNISSVTLMKPIMEMEGLEGKIKLNTPITAEYHYNPRRHNG